jgi:hypothetical protein
MGKKTARNHASTAEFCLLAHQVPTGTEGGPMNTEMVDLLADLRHLCDREGWDFGEVDRKAYQLYLLEKNRNGG